MPNLIIRPIVGPWPGPQPKCWQSPAKFKSSWDTTVRKLENELDWLGADGAVIELAVKDSDIRITGSLKDGVRPAHQGAILSFNSKHGPMRYPCGTYSDWRKNVHAIALSLEALRAVDRHGVTMRGEQYRGFSALPEPPPQVQNCAMTREQAAKFLSEHSNVFASDIMSSQSNAATAYKLAAVKLHPDQRTGSVDLFKRLQQAKQLLGVGM